MRHYFSEFPNPAYEIQNRPRFVGPVRYKRVLNKLLEAERRPASQ
jgi:hypothetical protein